MRKFHNLKEINYLVQADPLNYADELQLSQTLFTKCGYQSKILELNHDFVVFFDAERECIDTGEIIEYEDDEIYIIRSDGTSIAWPYERKR